MSKEGQSRKKYLVKKRNEDDEPVECEGDIENENIAEDKMEGNKRSSPRRKNLKDTESGAPEKIDKIGKNKGDDDSSEEAEAGDEVKSKPSKSEDEECASEPVVKKRKLVKSVQENASGGENSQGRKSKPKKGRRSAKRLTPKKSKKKAKAEQDDGEYEVEKIVKVKVLKNGKKEFLIRWKGFSAEHDTWEPEANLTCKELVNQYFEEHKEEIEAPEEEKKKKKKGKGKRRGSTKSSGPKKTDSAADAEEDSAEENAKKGKGSSRRSRGGGKKTPTGISCEIARTGFAVVLATDSEEDGDAKTKKTEEDEGEDDSQNEGDPPKAEEAGENSATGGSEDQKEYEVEKIVDVRQRKEGDREFLIKWRGYPNKFNSWESENNMNCNEKIEKFLKSLEQNFTERELRIVRKRTDHFVANSGCRGRKLSIRLAKMPRGSYCEID